MTVKRILGLKDKGMKNFRICFPSTKKINSLCCEQIGHYMASIGIEKDHQKRNNLSGVRFEANSGCVKRYAAERCGVTGRIKIQI